MSGLVHLYCGDGKGKTTAAVGLSVRAAGSGLRVLFVQFLKSRPSGEIAVLSALANVRVLRGKEGTAFSFQMTDEQKRATREMHDRNLAEAVRAAKAGECDLLVLDEAVGALNRGRVDGELLRSLVREKPEALELVLTGRNPPEDLAEMADYVSEIRKVKHPFDRGIGARTGIER